MASSFIGTWGEKERHQVCIENEKRDGVGERFQINRVMYYLDCITKC